VLFGEGEHPVGSRRAREVILQQTEDAGWKRIHNEPRPATSDVHARGVGLRWLQLIIVPSFERPSAWGDSGAVITPDVAPDPAEK
jgi:hypothetical protein